MSKVELSDLDTAGIYCCGTLSSSAKSNTGYYDVFADVTTGTVTIANDAKSQFSVGSLHKDVAKLLVDLGDLDDEQKAVKLLAQKTLKIRSQLENLRNKPDSDGVTEAGIKSLGEGMSE